MLRAGPALILTSVLVALPLGLAACGSDGESSGSDATSNADETGTATPDLVVVSTATECTPDKPTVAAGPRVVRITNNGDKETELYIKRADGTVLAERETIEPGASEDMTVEFTAGGFVLECKPGKDTTTVSSALAATGEGVTERDARLTAAVAAYRAYVLEQSQESLAKTKEFKAAIDAGDVDKAKEIYAESRYGWESIEPVAEAFGDLDPMMDLREADLEAGQKWTGWHVIEKQLWDKNSTEGMGPVVDDLLVNLNDLVTRVPDAEITPTSMGNGAKELLDEVATGKITGEEEAFSHTDLVDFDANLAGAKEAYTLLKPVVAERQPELVTTLDTRFAEVEAILAKYRSGDTYVSFDTVTEAQRAEMASAVDGLAEPLSQLAAAVA